VFNFSAAQSEYLLVSYACFGMMGPAMFNFATAVASDRTHGWLTLKRISPMPFSAYLVAKLLSSTVFAAIIALILFVVAATFADVALFKWQWVSLFIVLLLGSLPFALIGLILGLYLSDKAAPAIVNLIYLPMAFLSGLWIPIQFLPEPVGQIAYALPAFHYAQISHKVIGSDLQQPMWLHLLFLSGFTVLLIAIARHGFGRLSK
jgi:ABC-2 type transport system permease protein